MNLFDQVSEDIKKAMLAKDKVALDALRGIKKEFLEAKTAKGGDGELHDDVALKILQKMVKQRKESAEMYTAATRQDLADDEMAQVKIIEQYLPQPMTEAELTAALGKLENKADNAASVASANATAIAGKQATIDSEQASSKGTFKFVI